MDKQNLDLDSLSNDANSDLSGNSKFITKLFYDESEKEFPVVSVIISFCSQDSYDEIYTQEKQLAPEGTRIAVYRVNLDLIQNFTQYILGKTPVPISEVDLLDLLNEISDIEPECILLNFECCSGLFHDQELYSEINNDSVNYKFKDIANILALLQYCISKGYYIMFADFSIKAIINGWEESILGPLPFINLGECSDNINLYFDPKILKDSESNQMRIVGELCRDGQAGIHCMSGTIVFGLDNSKISTTAYAFKLLTKAVTAEKFDNLNAYYIEDKYSIGHASLKYPSGSVIFFSAGHWIDLKNINVDLEDLENVKKKYGNNKVIDEVLANSSNQNFDEEEYRNYSYLNECNILNEKSCISEIKESSYQQQQNSIASKMIQKSSNCNYSVKNQLKKK